MPSITVNMHAAKTNLSQLLERAQAGEEVIIARAGVPVARLVPIHAAEKRRQPGGLEDLAIDDTALFDPMSAEELRLREGLPDPSSAKA